MEIQEFQAQETMKLISKEHRVQDLSLQVNSIFKPNLVV
jgi:hypothetical protein